MIPIRNNTHRSALEEILTEAGYETRVVKLYANPNQKYLSFTSANPIRVSYTEYGGLTLESTGFSVDPRQSATLLEALAQATEVANRLRPWI